MTASAGTGLHLYSREGAYWQAAIAKLGKSASELSAHKGDSTTHKAPVTRAAPEQARALAAAFAAVVQRHRQRASHIFCRWTEEQ